MFLGTDLRAPMKNTSNSLRPRAIRRCCRSPWAVSIMAIDQSLLVVGGTRVAHCVDGRARACSAVIDHRHHQAVGAGIEVADQGAAAHASGGRTMAAPPAPRIACAVTRIFLKSSRCRGSQSTKIASAPSSTRRTASSPMTHGAAWSNGGLALAPGKTARAVWLRSWEILSRSSALSLRPSGAPTQRARLDIGGCVTHKGGADGESSGITAPLLAKLAQSNTARATSRGFEHHGPRSLSERRFAHDYP